MLKDILYMVIGFLLLTGGADTMVAGASALAKRLGISPLVVGLTVVALGTSAPEMAVSLSASFTGRGDIAIGNVVGSNIGNIGLALGLSALIRPLAVEIRLVRFEVPLLFGVSCLAYLMALSGEIPRWFGEIFLLGLFVYIIGLYRWSLKEKPEVKEAVDQTNRRRSSLPKNTGKIIFGLACLAGGGNLLVDGAAGIARAAGLSDLVIGLSIVAVGTSMPEIVTAIVAVLRKQDDIAIGNVLGSNLFNTLGVLGASAAANPISVQRDLIVRDFPVMGLLTILLFPFLRTGFVLKRWEGLLLLSIYFFYMGLLLMDHL